LAAPAPAADPDHLPSPNEAFRPPRPMWEPLPEDWDKDQKAESANHRLAIPELRKEAPLREGPALPPSAAEVPAMAARTIAPALSEPSAAGSPGGAVAAFLEAAGLGGMKLSDPEAIELMQTAGACYREMMDGLCQILAARAVMKNEMRVERTVIGSVNNNPLKLLPTSDDAMAALLRPHARGYLPAVDAVREAFHDLKAHELATIAGMQAALRALLKRFDPANLKRRLDRHSLLASILPAARDAKYWAVYEQLYSEVASEAENSFNGLYGREFARAYEDQVKKL